MKKLILLILLLPGLAWAGSPYVLGVAGTATAPSSAYDGDENFETATTGYEETWSDYNLTTNTVDPVYSTTALRGNQSLHLTGIDSSTPRGIITTFSATSSFYMAMRLRIDTGTTADAPVIGLLHSTGGTFVANKAAVLVLNSAVRFGSEHGTRLDYDINAVMSTATLYYVWFEYEASAVGAGDGILRLYVNSSRTKPETATFTATDGLSEYDIVALIVTNGRSAVTVHDQILWDFNDPIGDMPE